MNKKELCASIATGLRELQKRKPVRKAKHVLHISDDYGNHKDFVVYQAEKTVIYNQTDIANIIDMLIEVIKEALCRGEIISIPGFGRFALHYRLPRRTKKPGTEEWVEIEGHHIPRFFFGSNLKGCAAVYDQHLKDEAAKMEVPAYDYSADPNADPIMREDIEE